MTEVSVRMLFPSWCGLRNTPPTQAMPSRAIPPVARLTFLYCVNKRADIECPQQFPRRGLSPPSSAGRAPLRGSAHEVPIAQPPMRSGPQFLYKKLLELFEHLGLGYSGGLSRVTSGRVRIHGIREPERKRNEGQEPSEEFDE